MLIHVDRGRCTGTGPCDRPPLSKAFLTDQADATDDLTEDKLRDELKVNLRFGVTATGLDSATRTVAA